MKSSQEVTQNIAVHLLSLMLSLTHTHAHVRAHTSRERIMFMFAFRSLNFILIYENTYILRLLHHLNISDYGLVSRPNIHWSCKQCRSDTPSSLKEKTACFSWQLLFHWENTWGLRWIWTWEPKQGLFMFAWHYSQCIWIPFPSLRGFSDCVNVSVWMPLRSLERLLCFLYLWSDCFLMASL